VEKRRYWEKWMDKIYQEILVGLIMLYVSITTFVIIIYEYICVIKNKKSKIVMRESYDYDNSKNKELNYF